VLRMAVTIPARLMGRPDLARIDGRRPEDLVWLTPELKARPLPGAHGASA